jgi:hypothetical protein
VAHDHHHHDDNYYVDQLCMIALCGAYGAIAVSLYFFNRSMLNLLVGPQFHNYVLWGGLALVVMVVVRAAMLWVAVGRKAQTAPATCDHGHDHHHHHEDGHACDHAHEHGHHHHHHEHAHALAEGHPPHSQTLEHGVATESSHVHAHSHEHGHQHHDHGHGHDDGHTHDSAPWRYVVMLIPVLLFLLGLPNKAPAVGRIHAKVDTTEDAQRYAGALMAGGPDQLNNLAIAAALRLDEGLGPVTEMDFKSLETAATLPGVRERLKGRTVRVKGQFAPTNDRVFSLVRFRIQCCAADRIPVDVTIISKNPLTDIQPPLKNSEWVEVTGKVDFRVPPGHSAYKTLLLVPQLRYIQPIDPDPSPWLE